MGKKKQGTRREARKERAQAAREAKREAEELAQRQRQRRIRMLMITAVLTIAAAALSHWVLDDRRLVGASLLIGGVLFLLFALGTLASGVKRRDRGRAGSIDFGKRD